MSENINYKPISQLNISDKVISGDLFLMSRKSDNGEYFISYQTNAETIGKLITEQFKDQYISAVVPNEDKTKLIFKYSYPDKQNDIEVELSNLNIYKVQKNNGLNLTENTFSIDYNRLSTELNLSYYVNQDGLNSVDQRLSESIKNLNKFVKENYLSNDNKENTYGSLSDNNFIYGITEKNGRITGVKSKTPSFEHLKGGGVIDGTVLNSITKNGNNTSTVQFEISNDCWVQLNGNISDNGEYLIDIKKHGQENKNTLIQWNVTENSKIQSYGFPSLSGSTIYVNKKTGNISNSTSLSCTEFKLLGVLQSDVLSAYALKTDLNDYAKDSRLSAFVEKSYATVPDKGDNMYVKTVSQTDGRITVTHEYLSSIALNYQTLDYIYPVGSIYTTVTDDSTCPLEKFRTDWKWTEFGSGRCLFGVSDGQETSKEIDSALPIPTIKVSSGQHSHMLNAAKESGRTNVSPGSVPIDTVDNYNIHTNSTEITVNVSVKEDNVYKKTCKTVQPPAITVRFWRRIS